MMTNSRLNSSSQKAKDQDSSPGDWADENVLSRFDCSFVASIRVSSTSAVPQGFPGHSYCEFLLSLIPSGTYFKGSPTLRTSGGFTNTTINFKSWSNPFSTRTTKSKAFDVTFYSSSSHVRVVVSFIR
jgi:hypothetical protein